MDGNKLVVGIHIYINFFCRAYYKADKNGKSKKEVKLC